MNMQGHLHWALDLLQSIHDAKKHLLPLVTQTNSKNERWKIQKLLDFTFLKFTSVACQGDLTAIACEGNGRRKLKTMAKNYLRRDLLIWK